MDGRLLPSRLRKRVAASIQHVALSLLREEKVKVSYIVAARYTCLKFARVDLCTRIYILRGMPPFLRQSHIMTVLPYAVNISTLCALN